MTLTLRRYFPSARALIAVLGSACVDSSVLTIERVVAPSQATQPGRLVVGMAVHRQRRVGVILR
ncbi:hypothetical protein BOX37_03800 [Nocardia mangyaensis]|uniref:Uncharacterized protein n=1 Tax=Nocardia mangyaensis TaxID=2213200 RepID=A0A1J0VMJ0_9NOCA|nr:hypothetical protein BOX37_03800 [Nocardia mangyaensis]